MRARLTPKAIGENSEGQVLARFLRHGEVVLLPFGDNQRYDMVLDRQGTFLRVQVKTGRYRNGAVGFATVSTGSDTAHRQAWHYRGQADYFAVYCPELDTVYMVPVDECGDRQLCLRIQPPRNHQVARLRWAKDYEYLGELPSPPPVAQVIPKESAAPKPPPPHGSQAAYRRGCKCKTCLAGHARRLRAWRANKNKGQDSAG